MWLRRRRRHHRHCRLLRHRHHRLCHGGTAVAPLPPTHLGSAGGPTRTASSRSIVAALVAHGHRRAPRDPRRRFRPTWRASAFAVFAAATRGCGARFLSAVKIVSWRAAGCPLPWRGGLAGGNRERSPPLETRRVLRRLKQGGRSRTSADTASPTSASTGRSMSAPRMWRRPHHNRRNSRRPSRRRNILCHLHHRRLRHCLSHTCQRRRCWTHPCCLSRIMSRHRQWHRLRDARGCLLSSCHGLLPSRRMKMGWGWH